MLGGSSVGGTGIGGRTISTGSSPLTGEANPFSTRLHLLQQPYPWVRLYDITVNKTPSIFLCDFFDPNSTATDSNLIRFDGNDYTPTVIGRRPIIETDEGNFPRISMSILDPSFTLLTFLQANEGLAGEDITEHLVPYDFLQTPTKAITRKYKILTATSSAQGPTVSVVVGLQDLAKIQRPSQIITRHKCFNDFQGRYEKFNLCNYPSDEFELSSRQDFSSSSNKIDVLRKYGWFASNTSDDIVKIWDTAGTSNSFLSDRGEGSHGLLIASKGTNEIRWVDSNQNGPWQYKLLEGSDGDFDVSTALNINVSLYPQTGLFQGRAGLMLMDSVDSSQWVLWSVQLDTGVAPNEISMHRINTVDDVSSESSFDTTDIDEVIPAGDWLGSPEREIRVHKNSNIVRLYHREWYGSQAVSPEPAWVLVDTITLDASKWTNSSGVKIGLVLTTNSSTAREYAAEFWYFRFSSGGFSSCSRDLSSCTTRKNTEQFNGFTGMPSQRGVAF